MPSPHLSLLLALTLLLSARDAMPTSSSIIIPSDTTSSDTSSSDTTSSDTNSSSQQPTSSEPPTENTTTVAPTTQSTLSISVPITISSSSSPVTAQSTLSVTAVLTPSMTPRLQGPVPTSTVVGAVVGGVGGLIVVLVMVVLVLLCVVRRKSQRSRDWIPPPSASSPIEVDETNKQPSFANATYGVPNLNGGELPDDQNIEVVTPTRGSSVHNDRQDRSASYEAEISKASSEALHEYCLPDEIRGIRMTAETSYEYAYAETEARKPSLPMARKLTESQPGDYTPPVSAGSISKPRSSSRRDREEIYMAPASDENSLYAQFNDFKINQVKRESITTADHLGSGQFGVVQKGMWQSREGAKIEVAVKTLQPESAEVDKVRFLQEAAIMGQFLHPNVVKLHGVVTVGEPVLIVLELLPKGDLRNLLVNLRTLPGESPDVHTLLSYCRQIAAGMTYLSGKSFVHRDLAARNILVTEDDICKIADFGMSRDLMDETYYISHGGKIPVKWTAPEALNYRKYSAASDVWSFGAVMYEIWSLGHKPFEGYTNPQTMREVEEGFRLPPPPGCPRAIYELMIKCWHPTTSMRPSFTDVSQHLSLSDPKLLKWAEEDTAVHPEAVTLGAQLEYTEHLYPDLQKTYSGDDNNL